MSKDKRRIGVFDHKQLMRCAGCGEEWYGPLGEYPYSWQSINHCGKGLARPVSGIGRDYVVYSDDTAEWIDTTDSFID